MIINSNMLKSKYSDYANINNKIKREIDSKKLYKIVNGIYETDPYVPAYLLSGIIYGPSYISFDYALSYYSIIPERVTTITYATYNKRKRKMYKTSFGVFTYQDIPKSVYSKEIILNIEGDYSYQIATLEKAICDKLYSLKPLHNINNLENMQFNDLRFNEDEFLKVDINKIEKLSKLYGSTNVKLLLKYLRRMKNE